MTQLAALVLSAWLALGIDWAEGRQNQILWDNAMAERCPCELAQLDIEQKTWEK